MRPFFWLHIKKAGGRSLRQALRHHYIVTDRTNATPFVALSSDQWNDALNSFRMPLGAYVFRRSLFARDVPYGSDSFSEMLRFAVVRNPYDRIVSAYQFLTQGSPMWKTYRLLGKKRAFSEFLARLPDKWAEPHKCANRRGATHTTPIMFEVTDEDGNVILDRLFKLETIEAALPELAAGLTIPVPRVEHKNQTTSRRSYPFYYSPGARHRAEMLYGADIEYSNYEF